MFTNVNRPSAVDVLRPFTVGDLFTADTTSTLSKVAAVAVGNVLLSAGANAIPTWGKITLTSHVTGVLPAINGGTGVANTGTITNASNTTITGGGTVALGGFTLTVPASGTAALLGSANAFTNTVTVVDGNFSITGSSDATKTIKFEADAQSAGADLTINSGAQTADRTLTVPVLTGNRTLAVIDQAQTFTALPQFNSGVNINGGSYGAGTIYTDAAAGLVLAGRTGSVYDWTLLNGGGSSILYVPAGTTSIVFLGRISVINPETPASAAAAGTQGTIAWDTNYIYICTAPNTWKRVAIATW